jgi:hypothetical protein
VLLQARGSPTLPRSRLRPGPRRFEAERRCARKRALAGESACATIAGKRLAVGGAGGFACELHFFSPSSGAILEKHRNLAVEEPGWVHPLHVWIHAMYEPSCFVGDGEAETTEISG